MAAKKLAGDLARAPRGTSFVIQKHAARRWHDVLEGSPSPIHRVPITDSDGDIDDYMRVDSMPGLVGLAQMGTLEIHAWGAHADDVERPDITVFDLDPDEGRAPVAVPIAWEELARGIDPLSFTTLTVPKRLGELAEDPWKDMATTKQAITAAMWKAVRRKGPRT